MKTKVWINQSYSSKPKLLFGLTKVTLEAHGETVDNFDVVEEFGLLISCHLEWNLEENGLDVENCGDKLQVQFMASTS